METIFPEMSAFPRKNEEGLRLDSAHDLVFSKALPRKVGAVLPAEILGTAVL
jgi:hypothetical protein